MIRSLLLVMVLTLACIGQETGSVEGSVISAADGRPIAGAAVVIQGLDLSGDPPLGDSYVTQTGADGRYRVEGVVPGPYEARVQHEAFTAQAPGVAPSKIYVRFQVEVGKCASVVSRLMRLGAISGRVMDGDGDPVSAARIEAMRYAYSNGKQELAQAAWVRSNDHGDFRLFGLPPGRYYLKASKQYNSVGLSMAYLKIRGSKPAVAYAASFYPGSAGVSKAVPLDLVSGGEMDGANIQLLSAATYTIHAKLAGAESGSRPRVVIGPLSGGGLYFGGDARPGGTTSYPNAAPGSYLVQGIDEAKGLFTQQAVEVVNSDVDVTIELAPEIVLNGTVRVEGGAHVAIEATHIFLQADQQAFSATATVKPDGALSIRRVLPMRYRIQTTAPAGTYLKSIRLGETVLANPAVDLSRNSGALTFTLGTDGGKLDGVVLDSTGSPAEGAVLVLIPEGPLASWQDLVRSTVSKGDGKFELHDLAPGSYSLLAWEDADPEAVPDPEFRRPFLKQATAIQVAPSRHQTLQLKALSVMQGR